MSLRETSWPIGLALLAATMIAACGGGGGGATVTPPAQQTYSLGLAAHVVENADDVKLFNLGFGTSQAANSVSWAQTMPPVGAQGHQGSCVGWAFGYYLKTSWEQREEGWSAATPNHQFSPAWLYDQIKLNGCDSGSLPRAALDVLENDGCATLATAPYDDKTCSTQPTVPAANEAAGFKNLDRRVYGTYDLRAFKEYLERTGPLVFGIDVYDSFAKLVGAVYSQVTGSLMGKHAIACVGYDDSVSGGAFRLVNSWGTDWGDGGYVWVTYDAMEQVFMGAWAMQDGPNTGGGGGAQLLPAPTGFNASQQESDYYVWTAWRYLPGAAGYLVQRQASTGAWQTIAQPPSDATYHYDFNVAPGTTYVYRLAALNLNGEAGSWATASGRTSARATVSSLNLVASHPFTGTSYPDRIALNWDLAPGSNWYILVRADTSEGLRAGQYFILDVSFDGTSYNDYVSPGSSYAYKVFAANPILLTLSGESEVADGSTSGVLAGQDVGIAGALYPLVVTRGTIATCFVNLANYSLSASPSQRIAAGVDYYFADGSYGTLQYWDTAWTTPILDWATGTSLPSFYEQLWTVFPVVPEYLLPQGTLNVGHWWYFRTDPLDAQNSLVPDIRPWNNDYHTPELLFVQ